MLALATVRRERDALRPKGRGVCEEGARLLRAGPGRPTHSDQDRFFRDLAEPRGSTHEQRVDDVRRRHDGDEATTRNYVRCKGRGSQNSIGDVSTTILSLSCRSTSSPLSSTSATASTPSR